MGIINITVDSSDFTKALKKYFAKDYPLMIAQGFRSVAIVARDAARQRTAEKYKLHSNYIPSGILSTPFKDGQVDAAARSYAAKHDLIAAVFLRPSGDARKGLGFMVPHETGEPKTSSKGGSLIVPTYGIEQYSFRTSRGAVKTQYTAAQLLEGYTKQRMPSSVLAMIIAQGSKRKGKKGPAFITKTDRGVGAIAQRTGGARIPIQFLYVFKDHVKSDGQWGFETTIRNAVTKAYEKEIAKYVNK